MKKLEPAILLLSALLLLLQACRKEVDVDVPEGEKQYVVEGRIEEGRPPFVILTQTQPYFSETSKKAQEERFVHDADIWVKGPQKEVKLQELCSSEVPDSLLDQFSSLSGLDEATLKSTNICIYTTTSMFGQNEKSYELEIEVGDDRIRSSTYIPPAVPLDSVWFELFEDRDEEGLAWALINDPDSSGNAYRWHAKRIQKGEDGEPADNAYIAPLGSVLDDRFFNGKEFEFNYSRGQTPAERDPGEEKTIFFEVGDTIAVKWATISQESYRFYRSFEEAVLLTGSPFAQPTDIKSNVDSALGVWSGYGVRYDTIVANP